MYRQSTQEKQEAYNKIFNEVQMKLKKVDEMMKNHAKRQAANPENTGLAGDMAHYSQILDELLGIE